MGRLDLAAALTIDCRTGLCFYGHPMIVQYTRHTLRVLALVTIRARQKL